MNCSENKQSKATPTGSLKPGLFDEVLHIEHPETQQFWVIEYLYTAELYMDAEQIFFCMCTGTYS